MKRKPDVVRSLVLLALGVLAGYVALGVLKDGQFRAGGRSHPLITRGDDPVFFWVSFAWISAIATALCVAACRDLIKAREEDRP